MAIKGTLWLLAVGLTAVVADSALVAVVRVASYTDKYNVTGDLTLTQSSADGPVVITGTIYGLSEGLHGFHVHQTGDLRDGCTSAKAHYNPDNHNHGAPEDTVRHAGDLGNIHANSNGVAEVNITDHKLTLTGPNTVLGRMIVVHADEDDLGRTSHQLSSTTGNAGDRAGCGIIAILSPLDRWGFNSAGSIFSSSTAILVTIVATISVLIQDKF